MKTSEHRVELRTWRFVIDQNDLGEERGWHLPSYNHEQWMEVEAYRAWETYDLAMADYEGVGWYYTTVRAPGIDKRFILHFDGIGGIAKVFVNGALAGTTDNRYLPFDVDATPFVKPGQDACILVKVDNSYQGRHALTGGSRIEWVLYGGLTHHVYAEEHELCRIRGLCIRANCDGSATVQVKVENKLPIPFAGKLKLSMPEQELEQAVTVKAGECETVCFTCKAEDVKPWSPDAPNLYACKAELTALGKTVHTATERFGYRTIETRGTEIFLNGEKILLRGSNRYDEYAPYANCAPAALIREDLLDMKRCGMNLVRTHYPQDPIHYEIADEIGIMYMIEVPLNWWQKRKADTEDDWENADWSDLTGQAVDTLDRTWENFCNHPCWTIWSTGNECTHSDPKVRSTFEMLAARMRALDCGKLITYAANKPILDSEELAYCDVISMNYYSGVVCNSTEEYPTDIDGTLVDKLKIAQELYPDKPHMMSEFGYPCIAGLRGSPTEGRFTEDFGATYFKAASEKMMQDPQMQGLITWCWADYRHRRGFIAPGPRSLHLSATYGPYGIKTMDRKTKTLVYDAVREIFEKFR